MPHRQPLLRQMIAEGNLDGASSVAEEFVVEAPDDAMAYFLWADCLVNQGRFRQAVEVLKRGRALGGPMPEGASSLFAKLRALAPFDSAYSEILCRPSSFLGTWNPASGLQPHQTRALAALLDSQAEAWEKGEIPPPLKSDVFAAADGLALPAGLPVLVVMLERVGIDPRFIESDIAFHFFNSARSCGLDAHFFAADAMTYESNLAEIGDAELAANKARLAATIEAIRPRLVVTDGNYIPTGRGMSREEWALLKRTYGFRLAVSIPDCYDTPGMAGDGRLEYWSDCADVINVYHMYSSAIFTASRKEILFPSPGLPFCEALFDAAGPAKEMDMFFSATASRHRLALLNAAQCSGIGGSWITHDRTTTQAPSNAVYVEQLSRSRLSMNNGRIGSSEYINTARAFEAVVARSLLLEDVGSYVDEFMVPFVHYVPFSSLHELIAAMQFFKADEERRLRLTTAAREFWNGHYHSRRYWAALLAQCRVIP